MQSHTAQRFDIGDPKGRFWLLLESLFDVPVYLHTGQPEPFQLCRQRQWKTCWHGIVMRPLVLSILSRHTGHVGSSMRFAVGGGYGLEL